MAKKFRARRHLHSFVAPKIPRGHGRQTVDDPYYLRRGIVDRTPARSERKARP